MSIRAMPHKSLGPKATRQGKDLFTPSLLRIACIAHHWILFKMAMSIVVTGREYIIDGMYVLQ
jgi:hypothetical protein